MPEKKGTFLDFIKSFAPGGETPAEAWQDMFTPKFFPEDSDISQSVFDSGSSADKVPITPDKLMRDKFFNIPTPKPIEERVTDDNNSSASKSAEEANRLTSEWFTESMQYNAEQARLDREFQQSSADKAMQFEAQEAQKLRDWQEMLSNTQYQRAVADLKKAGLNPILVAQHLSGASTPSGSSASGSSASGSRASASHSSATKAEVDLNSRARLIEAYLKSETSLKETERKNISNLLSALIGLGGSFAR